MTEAEVSTFNLGRTQSPMQDRTTQSQILSLSDTKSNSSVDRGSEKERGGTNTEVEGSERTIGIFVPDPEQ